MIVHRTFTEQTTGLTGQAALGKPEKLREKAEEFIANELNEEDVINIAETAMTVGGLIDLEYALRYPEQVAIGPTPSQRTPLVRRPPAGVACTVILTSGPWAEVRLGREPAAQSRARVDK